MNKLNTVGGSLPTVESLRDVVYDIVSQIPYGRVLTYGAIALLAGFPNHSRLVGRIMRDAPDNELPCHRVVTSTGRLAPHFPAQAELLTEEGVNLLPSGRVSLKKYLWHFNDYMV